MSDQWLTRYGPAAIVTGASSGIGASFAKLLAAAGFDLLLVARRLDRLQSLADALSTEHSVEVKTLEADLSDPDAAAHIAQAAAAMDIGLLVSNAGFGLKGPHHAQDVASLNDMINVNCVAPMQLAHHFIPALLQRESGGIIITGSVEGIMGFPNSAAYAASKAFVQNLGESLWGELEAHNIDVLVLEPSSTDTEAFEKQGIDRTKLAGIMSADEVAQIGLENLANGPVIIAGEDNAALFTGLGQMPRRDALRMMGQSMLDTLKTD